MKTKWSKWIAVLAVVVSQKVTATVIVTDVVVVGGQEWAQVDLFTGSSWSTINAQCPSGACSSATEVNGYNLEGWTWASIESIQTLFNTFTG